MLTTPIAQNSLAFYSFPLSSKPSAGKAKIIPLRIFSNLAIGGLTIRIYVGNPLVAGQFQTNPTQWCEYNLPNNWIVGPSGLFQNSVFSFTPTAAQVTNGICMVAKTVCPGTSGCSCPTSFTNITSNPLAAVFNLPWP